MIEQPTIIPNKTLKELYEKVIKFRDKWEVDEERCFISDDLVSEVCEFAHELISIVGYYQQIEESEE